MEWKMQVPKTTHALHEIEIHEYNILCVNAWNNKFSNNTNYHVLHLPSFSSIAETRVPQRKKRKLCHWNVNGKVSKKGMFCSLYLIYYK